MQLSTMQPTPARSPTWKSVTFLPTADTMPTISCPGTWGYVCGPQSPRSWWMSEWQMLAYLMSMTMSSSPMGRRSNSKGFSSPESSKAARARTVPFLGFSAWAGVARRVAAPRAANCRRVGWSVDKEASWLVATWLCVVPTS